MDIIIKCLDEGFCCLRLWQIINLLATVKSQYFASPRPLSFKNISNKYEYVTAIKIL